MDNFLNYLKGFGYLFYIASPKDTSFERHESVPDYITQVIPYFVTLIIIEYIIDAYKGLRRVHINDAITSLSQGICMELSKIFSKGIALIYYVYIYENWRIYSLQWDSITTWIIAFIAVDFGFYWIHRATHEINLFWASHQVHHSSQEYNLTTALRQSVLHLLFQYFCYMPLALAIPPAVFLVHNQFNVLYQFWIHTQYIKTIGPLEYILNTPSHHRVHHGANRYCIDKNYGGVLIIWDRIFGTFERERDNISYGLTKNVQTFDPLIIQFHHFSHIFTKIKNTNGFLNKLKSIFYGPGWTVGSNRLGDNSLLAEYPEDVKYNPKNSLLNELYILLHFSIILMIHTNLMQTIEVLPQNRIIICSVFIFISLTSFGYIMDRKKWSEYFEIFRCLLFLFVQKYFFNSLMTDKYYFLISIIQNSYRFSILILMTKLLIENYKSIENKNKIKTN